jgi:hypothetical protein
MSKTLIVVSSVSRSVLEFHRDFEFVSNIQSQECALALPKPDVFSTMLAPVGAGRYQIVARAAASRQ